MGLTTQMHRRISSPFRLVPAEPSAWQLMAIACCTLVGAACASSNSAERSSLTSSDSTVLLSSSDSPSLPVASLTNEMEALRVLSEKRAAPHVTTCMADKGFDFQLPISPAGNLLDVSRRYGISMASPSYSPPMPASPVADLPSASTSQPFNDALFGRHVDEITFFDPDGAPTAGFIVGDGCYDEAVNAAYGGLEWRKRFFETYDDVFNLAESSFAELTSGPIWRDLLTEWNECMKTRGITTTSPIEYVPGSDSPTDAGRVASFDLDCKQESRFLERAYAEEYRLQGDLMNSAGIGLSQEISDISAHLDSM